MTVLVKVILVLLGGLVGFLSKSLISRMSFKYSTTGCIVERYLDARDQLCKEISKCAVESASDDDGWLDERKYDLSRLYYQYYDYFPNEIIQELVCLQSCLESKGERLYLIDKCEMKTANEEDVEHICDRISTVRNFAPALLMNLIKTKGYELNAHRIHYQSRYTLIMINQYFTEQNLMSLNFYKPKAK